MPEFGAPMRAEFMLDFDKWVFANQGSYGACPRRVVEFRLAFCGTTFKQHVCFFLLGRQIVRKLTSHWFTNSTRTKVN